MISTTLIKELRRLTNMGVMECKQALIQTKGNIQLAIDNMRQDGLIKTINKSKRITTSGIILTKIAENKKIGTILELSCETDFVSKNDKFKKFGDDIITTALKEKIVNLNTLQKIFNEKNSIIISVLGENIKIRRVSHIKGEMIAEYVHNNKKIGVILSASGAKKNTQQLLKNIAMHIAASQPKYIDVHQIPKNIINHEKNIQINVAIKSGKTYEIAKKITEGRVNKFINEISLLNQPFVMDQTKKIMDLLNENNIKIENFIRFELGENT